MNAYRGSEEHLIPKVPIENPENVAILTLPDGKTVNLPIIQDTFENKYLDIRSLYAKTKMFTYDPGFTQTGSCSSQITYIDGDKGQLWFRGF